MSKYKKSITISISGRDWTFNLLPDKTFDKIHNADGGFRTAQTWVNQYKVDFRKSDWCVVDIIHELGHVIKAMSPIRSVELNADNVEELMCDIYSSNYFEIGLWTGRIAECFFGRE